MGEVLGLHYAVPWPNRELETGRPLRRSPVHDLVVAQGACLGSRNNWERRMSLHPKVFRPSSSTPGSAPRWVDWSVAEQRATREAVAVFDQTSFSKYLVVGAGAERALQWVCTADVGVPVGRAVYTGMLNSRGTYESDVTVTRTAADEFFVVSSAATTVRDIDWMRRHFPADAPAHVVDLTSAYAVFGVMGPGRASCWSGSRPTRSTTRPSPSPPAGRSGRARPPCGPPGSRMSASWVGSSTFPPISLPGVYEDLFRPARELGVVPAGYSTIESMRLEKGYRAFARELTTETGPVVAGLTFACKLGTDIDFLGRAAVEESRLTAPARRVVSFVVGDPAAIPLGWRAGAARRRAGRAGHQRGVGREPRRRRRAGPGGRPGHGHATTADWLRRAATRSTSRGRATR